MNAKLLLILLATASISSCSTAYKSGQTPDDVYYSPVRNIEEEQQKDDRKKEEDQVRRDNPEDRDIRMSIRNYRWRTLNYDYGYNYNQYSHHCNCYCNNYGYGYYTHPYYTPSPYYMPYPTYIPNKVNSTPRIINLGGYGGSNNGGATGSVDPKTGQPGIFVQPGTYNNSNNSSGRRSGSGLGNAIRQILSPSSSSSPNKSSSSGSNNTRTYQPSSSSSGSSSSGSSSSGSSGGSVSRPARGGK